MTSEEFKKFCKQVFYERGFKKIRNMYFLDGDKDVLCGIYLQKSNFGKIYYINVLFFIKGFNTNLFNPTYHDFDIIGRVQTMSKTETYKGKHFMTSQIEYEEYTEEELSQYIYMELENWIIPSIENGTKFIIQKLDYDLLRPNLSREKEVLKFLNLGKQETNTSFGE